MKRLKRLIGAVILTLLASPAFAAATSDAPPATPKDPVLEKVSAATARHDWTGAQSILKDALARDPRNADYHNLYA